MHHSKVLRFFYGLAVIVSASMITFAFYYIITLIFYDITSQFTLSQIELIDFVGCSLGEQATIRRDVIDAQTLALASLEPFDSTLAAEFPNPESYVEAGGTFTLDWTTDAAKEHWGRLSWDSDAEAHRTRILGELQMHVTY